MFLCAASAFLAFGADRTNSTRYSVPPISDPFAGAGHTLLGVASRWDSIWYLGVAHSGYDYARPSAAFFPLYPLLARAIGTFGDVLPTSSAAIFVAALAVSLTAFGAALYFVYRLSEVELGADLAPLAVALLAFFPMAVFYGEIYSESLFLALSAGAVWFARADRWALAGMLGAGAAATRSAGVLLLVPLAALYLLGPRGLGPAARPYLGLPWRRSAAGGAERNGPRAYPLRADAAWMALVPAALILYAIYLGAHTGDPFRFSQAQDAWSRELGRIGPLPAAFVGGIWQGLQAGGRGIGDLVTGRQSLGAAVWAPNGGGSLMPAGINVEAALFLCFALVATVGALRRLPFAYGAYAVTALALPLSYPRSADPGYNVPLFSLPRFVAVIFPLFMWLALVVHERGWDRAALGVSVVLLGLYAAQWGTWQWVA